MLALPRIAGATGRSRNRMPKDQSSNRRSEILRAAQKLMSEKGLNGVTTRQISWEVGCSEGALRALQGTVGVASCDARRITPGCAGITSYTRGQRGQRFSPEES